MKRRFTLPLSLLGLLVCGITAAQPYPVTPRLCPLPLLGEVEGESYSCGVLTVPENYNKPGGRTLEISFAVLKSTSLSPAPDPVLYLEGGPGASAIAGLQGYLTVFPSLRATRDVIFFDQRGTRYSDALACNPTVLAVQRYADSDPELAALLKDIEGLESDAELTSGQEGIIYGICAEFLSETRDLDHYNSINSALDVSNLVQALGYDTYNLYGISYGTRLALNVLRVAPEGVRSVVLDSSYPPQLNSYENDPAIYDEAFVNLFDLCAADSDCNAAYPDLFTQFETLLARLSEESIPLEPAAPIAGLVAAFAGAEDGTKADTIDLGDIGGMAEILNQQGNAVAGLYPQIISQLSSGTTDAYRAFLAGDSIDEDQQVDPDTLPPTEQLALQVQMLQQNITELQVKDLSAVAQNRPAPLWLNAVIDAINTFADDQARDAKLDLLQALYGTRDRATLVEYLNTALIDDLGAKDDAATLQQQLQNLSDDDVREVYEFIGQVADSLVGDDSGIDTGMFNAVDCSDETPFNDAANIAPIVAEMRFPLLATVRGEDQISDQQTTCLLWGESQSPASVKEPVVSGVPTLVFSGLFDVQTPPSWNARAQEGLSRSTLLKFPGAGHGVIVFSQCAKDVAAAFIANPLRAPNAACRATLKPTFVLPKGKQAVK